MIQTILKSVIQAGYIAVVLVATPIIAHAASTDWQTVDGGKMRMLAAPIDGDKSIAWGVTIEIDLDEGWKTYWENPGASGVPPQFNWDKSQNLKSIPKISFPTPKLMKDPSGIVIGYKHHVAFTGKAEPQNPKQPLSLALTAFFGICSDICIPVKVEFQLNNLTQTSNNQLENQTAKQAYEDGLKTLSQSENSKLKILNVEPYKKGKLLISTKIPPNAKQIALLPVGVSGWYLFPAKLEERNGDIAKFILDVSDIPNDAELTKTPIEYTLIADGISVASKLTSAP